MKAKDRKMIVKDFEERYEEEGFCWDIFDIALDMAYEFGRKSKEEVVRKS